MNRKFLSWLIVLILVGIGIYSIWYLTPKRYTKTIDGVFYQLGKEGVIEPIKMHLDGKLRTHINGKKSFHGAVEFEGKEVPQLPKDRTKLEMYYTGENFSTILSTSRIIDAAGRVAPDFYFYGSIYINDDFTAFTIKVLVNESNDAASPWSESDGYMITAPAKDRDEAMITSKELIKEFETKY
ncbi:hypothetical protein [Paenibacillus montanisoli]|uniref:hypothetical protein n=1 Tax=Paenibacillus montanisoli TaxID=2081970 RepID=UPI0010576919|nr:hypothetical protein [Paenibacillus montanisoli]